jgi:hypothetical protein
MKAFSRISLATATCVSGLAIVWGLYKLVDVLGSPLDPVVAGILIVWAIGSLVLTTVAMLLVRYQGLLGIVTTALLLAGVATILLLNVGDYHKFFLITFLMCFSPPTLLGLCLGARRRRLCSTSDL